ncbi:MAG: serine/threonine protein kinase [Lachnospiraceae bacterium]|nr:serine/threonine protein kinase [Lachnospiraceae bacterium]
MLFPKYGKERKVIHEILWFGRYRVLSEIGQGAGSTTYLVRHQRLGEYRAVKRISKQAEFAWQIREADILNHLKHPQIPTVYDIEEDDEYYYIVEEYAEGESLEAVMLQSSFITLDFIYHTIAEVADILEYLHRIKPKPLIYQDLKAEHVIIGKGGVKLIDFGIASFLDETGEKFQNFGTPEFCAPEKSRYGKISLQTDIYSLGKLLEKLILSSADEKSQGLMHIADKATRAEEAERYLTIAQFKSALIQQMQFSENPVYQKHLLRKIIVAGSQPRVGATHFAISLTTYLNQQKVKTVYQEKTPYKTMQKLIQSGGFAEEDGLYRRGNFVGIPKYGEGVSVQLPIDAIEVLDYGRDIAQAALVKADMFVLVLGSRKWEQDESYLAYEKVKGSENLVLVCNYGDSRLAKRYAADWKERVYCFPLDAEPFCLTKEKERLFGGMLAKRKGGRENNPFKSHWNRRKYPGKRRDTFSSRIGKLYDQRLR